MMFRPSCQSVQVFLQQNYKVNSKVLLKIWRKPFTFCPGCRKSQLTTGKLVKKLKSSGFFPVLNITRVVSSDSQDGSGSNEPGSSGKIEASAASKTTGSKSQTGDGVSADEKKTKLLKVSRKSRKTALDYSYTDNIYILPYRALSDYMLKPSDLEGLPKYSRRSPYDTGRKITLYLRSDVEELGKKVWGSLESLNAEKAKRRNEEFTPGRYDIFHVRSIIEEHKRNMAGDGVNSDEKPYLFITEHDDKKSNIDTNKDTGKTETFLQTGSGKVVISAIAINGFNCLIKFIAWVYTGSHSMFSEFIHSGADTVNQIILALGLYHSIKKPDSDHPYGYTSLRHISSLISGVGIFCFGTGLSIYHGYQGLMHPVPFDSLVWGIATLLGSLLSEGATLVVAVNQVRKSSKALDMRFWEYVLRGNDPNVSVVLLEDVAAVSGVIVAASCMAITHYTNNPLADSIGSLLIGGILAIVAGFIIKTNTEVLVGRSIPMYVRQDISRDLETDRMIRSLHDIKATEVGGEVRFKAEVDFDGREITRAYLYKLDLEQLLSEMHELHKVEDVEKFMLNHGEKIVDMLGEEVDRIEKKLKTKHPELRHVDLEAL
ncbi:hypothetical protein SNE40_015950 [Patella caerulea]|uniref:Proton-coupled zinc antiporter SLC30A9, mitochondrial n=1 Tax=Patella caerulea TaxID=87958 RepID=A0AAN8J7X5_PATCE